MLRLSPGQAIVVNCLLLLCIILFEAAGLSPAAWACMLCMPLVAWLGSQDGE